MRALERRQRWQRTARLDTRTYEELRAHKLHISHIYIYVYIFPYSELHYIYYLHCTFKVWPNSTFAGDPYRASLCVRLQSGGRYIV